MTLISANDAFTNPNSPWYYVVGSAFLVLIIAALVIYTVVSKKKRAAEEEREKMGEKITDTTPPDELEQTSEQPDEKQESAKAEEPLAEEHPEAQEEPAPTVEEQKAEPEPEKPSEESSAPTEEAQTEKEEQLDEPEKAAKPAKTTKAANAEKTEKAANTVKTDKPAAKKPASTAKKTKKAFIDSIISDKSLHGVYNELKNTVLSYPGIKAKLGKDVETFAFAAQDKVEFSLDGSVIVLKLAVDFDAVPAQFGAETTDGELPTKLTVSENNIDSAQKLIVFAMNISMLTRNDRHRHVDYVQNAINAKNRAKAKQTAAAKEKK